MGMIDIHLNPSQRQLRQFACVWLAFFGAGGGLVLHRHSWPTSGLVAWICLACIGVTGLLIPRWMRLFYIVLSVVTFPIGWVVSHLILTVIYYLVFTPIALAMRVIGRDPLNRQWEPDRKSYWQPRSEITDIRRYYRQY